MRLIMGIRTDGHPRAARLLIQRHKRFAGHWLIKTLAKCGGVYFHYNALLYRLFQYAQNGVLFIKALLAIALWKIHMRKHLKPAGLYGPLHLRPVALKHFFGRIGHTFRLIRCHVVDPMHRAQHQIIALRQGLGKRRAIQVRLANSTPVNTVILSLYACAAAAPR